MFGSRFIYFAGYKRRQHAGRRLSTRRTAEATGRALWQSAQLCKVQRSAYDTGTTSRNHDAPYVQLH